MKRIKNRLLIIALCLALICKTGELFSQKVLGDSIQITFCENFIQNNSRIIQLSLLYNDDTLIIPKIGKDLYLSPYKFHNLKVIHSYDDTTDFPVLVETCNYSYIIKIDKKDFFCSALDLCIEPKVYANQQVKWVYYDCTHMGTLGFTTRIKNRRSR